MIRACEALWWPRATWLRAAGASSRNAGGHARFGALAAGDMCDGQLSIADQFLTCDSTRSCRGGRGPQPKLAELDMRREAKTSAHRPLPVPRRLRRLGDCEIALDDRPQPRRGARVSNAGLNAVLDGAHSRRCGAQPGSARGRGGGVLTWCGCLRITTAIAGVEAPSTRCQAVIGASAAVAAARPKE